MATIIEVQTALQRLTNKKVTYTDMGNVLGTGRSNISLRAKNNSQVSEKEIKLLEEVYNVSLDGEIKQILNNDMPNANDLEVDYYPDVLVSCGNGIFALGETKERISIPKSIINRFSPSQKYIVVTAFSDSMTPEIKEKDLLIVRVTNLENIIDNHIYVFCHDGRFYCKYLSYNLGQLIVKSSNPNYPTRYIEKEEIENFELIGEIVGLMRDFR